jgi:hypothetical protein
MPLVTYDKPIITLSLNRPMHLANKPLPYNNLADPKRFEELIFSLYHSEIQNGRFDGFDDISLMNLVGDKGRDCALLKNGKNYGLIQCKKYHRSYGKDEFGMEITKFALYALLEKSLIHDVNDFTYYIAVSFGFVLTCNDFIDDFNTLILTEAKLDSWISKNITNPTLSVFKLKSPKREVLAILSKIKVKKIQPPMLDSLLYKDYNRHLLPLFFQVSMVTDNRVIERVGSEIMEHLKKGLNDEQINKELVRGSITIKSQKNEFEGIPDSHIPRAETQLLYNWVVSTLRKDKLDREENICLLAANAGMGKTVIIKDLYDRLQSENMPTLALKADKLYANSITSLQEKIGVSLPIFDFIEQCKQHFPKLVILIDQIDALSQSLSSDRSFLNTYTQLINYYKFDPSVRIIISVRLFDLYYDPALKVYKDIKSFEVKKLDPLLILSQLQKIGISENNITNGLLELLQTPNNLDVFSRIYNQERSFAGIKSIQDLYNELWNLKILNPAPRLEISADIMIDLVYGISDAMYVLQQITVSEIKFERFTKELNYLKTEQLIKVENREIQFFHQSFYDYVFAKRFVENNSSIKFFLKSEKQSIMVRSALKMILNHLRAYDHHYYIKQMEEVLTGRLFFFHIKHLLISTLAGADSPTRDEIKLVMKVIMPNLLYAEIFFEHVMGASWFNFLLENNLLDKLLTEDKERSIYYGRFKALFRKKATIDPAIANKNRKLTILHNLLRKNIHHNRNNVIDFLLKTGNDFFVFRALYSLKDWSNPKALLLMDRFDDTMLESQWGYYHLLEEIAEYSPAYVFEKIKPKIFKREDERRRNNEHSEEEMLRILFEKIPVSICDYTLKHVVSEIPTKIYKGDYSDLIDDYFIGGIDLAENEQLHGKEYFYTQFASSMRNLAREKSPFYKDFLKLHLCSPYKSLIKLVVFSLQTNEVLYPDEIYELIVYLSKSKLFDYNGKLNHEVRQLLKEVYLNFNESQKKNIKELIERLVVKKEMWKWNGGGKKFYSKWGLTKFLFLKALPAEELIQDKNLKRFNQELTRRFGLIYDTSGRGSPMARVVEASMKQSAYEHMSKKNWIRSFQKYNPFCNWDLDTSDNSFHKGGLSEHSQAFSKESTAQPEKHLEIIREIIDDVSIAANYIIKGIEGITIAKFARQECIVLLKKVIKRELDASNSIYCMYLAEKLVDNDDYDAEILDFVIDQALHSPYPDRVKEEPIVNSSKGGVTDYVRRGLGTNRGIAARILVHITDTQFEDKIFDALSTIFTEDIAIVKAAAIQDYAYLTNLNGKKAFELFIKIVNDNNNKRILSSSLWSLSYLVNYDFERLTPLFGHLTVSDELRDNDNSWLSTILFGAWIHNYAGAEKLFKSFLAGHEEVKDHVMHDAIAYFYDNEEISGKSIEVIELLLKQPYNKDSKRIKMEFYQMDHIKFEDIFPLIKKYIKSPHFRIREHFLEFLTDHASKFPCECIYLFELAINMNVDETDEDGRLTGSEDLATKFIIGAYSSLRPTQFKKHKKYEMKVLKAFDKVLIDERFRNNAENILEKVIS